MLSVQNVSASVFQIQGESHTQTPLLRNTETKRLNHGSPNSYFWHLTILVILSPAIFLYFNSRLRYPSRWHSDKHRLILCHPCQLISALCDVLIVSEGILTMISKSFRCEYFTQLYYVWVLNFLPQVYQCYTLVVRKPKTCKNNFRGLKLKLIHSDCHYFIIIHRKNRRKEANKNAY